MSKKVIINPLFHFYSPNSPSMRNFTEPASSPLDIATTATSSRSVHVTWDAVIPIDQNGVITMYEVLYQPLETFGGAIEVLTTNVSQQAANLTDLEEFVNYTISVRAYTSVGAGPYSDGVMISTPHDCEYTWRGW